MAEVTVTRELGATRGRYVGRIAGTSEEAELTFARINPALWSADHTFTPVPLRGKRIATKLVERLVADARKEGFKIVPACPFVKDLFDHHPEWSDLKG